MADTLEQQLLHADEIAGPGLLLAPVRVARVLDLSTATLRNWRKADPPKGPPYVTLESGEVRYPYRAFVEWLNQMEAGWVEPLEPPPDPPPRPSGRVVKLGGGLEYATPANQWDEDESG
jgi:hypothetical protein